VTKKKVKFIPKLSDSVIENIEMFDEQCYMTSNKARNSKEDMCKLVDQFRDCVTDLHTVNYVFWRIIKLYMSVDYPRKSILQYIMFKFQPYEFYVYQLMKGSEVVYVGKSCRLAERLFTHKADNKDFDNVRLYLCSTIEEQDIVENASILDLLPILNKTVNLEMARKCSKLPEFKPIQELKPDFIGLSLLPYRFTLDDDYHLIQGIGFIHSRVVAKPYWK
jgi:hypothetical protein